MTNFLYDLFSWLFSKISKLLPFKYAANPSEKVVREQLQQYSIATNNQSLQDLIVDIVSHLPSAEEILNRHSQQQQQEQHQEQSDEEMITTENGEITSSILEMIPQLYDGTYREAVEYCKNNDKLLFVYLHSPGHDDTYDFIENIFCKREFIEFANANFVVYASSIKSADGYFISNQLHVTSYPFLAILLGNKPHWRIDGINELKSTSQASSSATEIHIIDTLITQMIEVHERLDSQLIIQRNEKQQREYERRAIEEQDRAYEESLRIDREKEEKRLQVERERQAIIDQFNQKLMLNSTTRDYIRQNTVFYNNEPTDFKNIKLKLPNGTETQRKFSLHLTFADLHRFIHAFPSNEWQPSKYSKLETDYELTLNSFPKRLISFDDSQTLASIEGKALLIYVREAEHEEDEQFALQHSL